MAKVIKFNNCINCPFGKEGWGLKKNDALCPMISSLNGHRVWRLIWDADNPPKDCPFPKGIIVTSCKVCPYVKENYGYYCPKIEDRCLIEIENSDKFHKDCPLEGYDYVS